MKFNLKDLINTIKCYEGGIVNIIKDSEPINNVFLQVIKTELSKNYIIKENFIDHNGYLDEKILIIINYNNNLDFSKMFGNPNLTYIILRDNSTTNLTLKNEMVYGESFIILLKNKYLKIIKSRLFSPYIVDLNSFLRKIKLETLKNL